MSVKKLGIVIYGACNYRNGFWEEWLDKARELVCTIGYTPTHACIIGTSFPEKLRTFKRSEKKMKAVMASGEPVESVSIYSLPKNFYTSSDNNCWLCMRAMTWGKYEKYSNYAYCEINFEEYNEELAGKIKSVLLGFIEMEQYEIFTMDKNQLLFNYVFKGMGDDIKKYPTLDILLQEDQMDKTGNSRI